MWRIVVLSLVAASATTCNSGPQPQTCATPKVESTTGAYNLSTSQLGSGCDGSIAGAAAGAPCKSGGDCAPACCACQGSSSGGESFSVQDCTNIDPTTKMGVCATDDETCCTFAADQMDPSKKTCP